MALVHKRVFDPKDGMYRRNILVVCEYFLLTYLISLYYIRRGKGDRRKEGIKYKYYQCKSFFLIKDDSFGSDVFQIEGNNI